ncbi:uncharacterized protein LOC106655922 isoform X2 [Trichogramma pretiosum]|uniref:uncharacterized protein LOC106655922 isoform X2 n=1 Tax=Trichogramma pretiosum TaxID=7493 RepID=UPI0006C9C520|nr:uncharacterized protein LOC106655922 isoform X2 [Trichogramma pretiosum]
MDPSINSLLTSWMLDDLSYYMLLHEITYEEFINLSKSKIDLIVPDSHSTSRNKLNNVLELYRKTLNSQKPVLADVSNLNQNASSNDCYYETSKVPTERDKFKDYQDFYTQIQKNKRMYKLLHHADCLWGSIILYMYAYQGNISSLRDELSKILVDAELDKTKESTLPFHIPSKVFQSLSQEIVDFFPCEEKKVYYDCSYTLSKENRLSNNTNTKNKKGRVNATGKLQNAYSARRGHIEKKTNLLINLHPQVTQVKTDTPTFTASETLLDINCLLNKPEDLSDSEKYHIIENWMTSYSYRKQTYTEKGLDLIKKLKVLETDLAYQLISYDFKKTFDEAEKFHKNLLTEWAQSAEFLVQYAKSLSENTVKFDVPELNGNYIKVDYSNLDDVFLKIKISTDGNADTLAFLILPALIKHTFRSNQSSGTWKITKEKSTDSFMQHIKDHELLDTIKNDYSKFLQSHSVQEPQPYVVCCGPLDALTCVHAVVGDIVYDFTTATEAVDFLYKTLRVLDIQYPVGCPHVWSYFQLIFNQKDRRVIAKNKCLELDADIKELKNKRQRTK